MTISKHNTIYGALAPGLPHLLTGNHDYEPLTTALEMLGTHWANQGVKRILYFSTQWRSVLGHMFLAGPSGGGIHVDENWHDLTDIPFNLVIDSDLAQRCSEAAKAASYQTKVIDFEGFPIDTGTLVVDRIVNNKKFSISAVSCSIYSDYQDTRRLAQSLAQVLLDYPHKTAVLVVSSLSGRPLNDDYGTVPEGIATEGDQRFNQRCLELIGEGRLEAMRDYASIEGSHHLADMGLRGLAFLEGLGIWTNGKGGDIKAYGTLHGTGAAVISF